MIGGEQDGTADVNTFLRQSPAGRAWKIASRIAGGKLLLAGGAPGLGEIYDISGIVSVTGGFAICDRLRIIPPEPSQSVGQNRRAVPNAVTSFSHDEFYIVSSVLQRQGHRLIRQIPISGKNI